MIHYRLPKPLDKTSPKIAEFLAGFYLVKVGNSGEMDMENMDFGLTLTVLGMGGTLVILFLISLVVDGLNKIFIRSDRSREARKPS